MKFMKKSLKWFFRSTIILFVLLIIPLHSAIDLVTVPKRDSVQLTIYNSADITMVRETRTLTFKKGLNTVQFAWAGTLIDPTSLRIAFKEKKDRIELLDTTFPPNINDALQWNIESEFNGPVKIEITYFTSGITWRADYVAITNTNEKEMTLKGFVKVINHSGEDYPNAKVRLIVGTINLVENIADLARGSWKYRELSKDSRRKVRDRMKGYIKRASSELDDIGAVEKKKIIKEGLSEYFIFTIEGKETIPNGWQKRLNSIYVENVPVDVIYRLSEVKTRSRVHKIYEFKNRKVDEKEGAGQLGESPLPDGIVYIFSEDKVKNLSYMGSVHVKYIPSGDRVELDVGPNLDVQVKRVLKDYKRNNIKLDTYYTKRTYVKSYDEIFDFETVIKNTLKRPVKIEIERLFSGKFKIENMPFRYEKVNYRTLKFYPDLRPKSRSFLKYRIVVSHGK